MKRSSSSFCKWTNAFTLARCQQHLTNNHVKKWWPVSFLCFFFFCIPHIHRLLCKSPKTQGKWKRLHALAGKGSTSWHWQMCSCAVQLWHEALSRHRRRMFTRVHTGRRTLTRTLDNPKIKREIALWWPSFTLKSSSFTRRYFLYKSIHQYSKIVPQRNGLWAAASIHIKNWCSESSYWL